MLGRGIGNALNSKRSLPGRLRVRFADAWNSITGFTFGVKENDSSCGERTALIRGAHAPSRVASGALADGIPKFHKKCMRFKDVAGEGAGAPATTRAGAWSPLNVSRRSGRQDKNWTLNVAA